MPEQAWTGRTRGGVKLFRCCAFLLPFVGRPGAYLGSFIIGAAFLLKGGRRQFGMVDYWRRLHPTMPPGLVLLRCWRHFASFGRILCDRLLVYLHPNDFQLQCSAGVDTMRQALESRTGCILLSAHLGNWELTGFLLPFFLKHRHPIFVVMVRDDLPTLQRFVDQRLRSSDITVIDPRDGLAASLAIVRALEDGHPVCMLGDRVMGEQSACTVDFLGAPARFPLGPFQAAAITGVPIFSCFLLKGACGTYELMVDPPWKLPVQPRGQLRERALKAAVAEWSRRLEEKVRRHPLQWHNFFHFWSDPERRLRDVASPLASRSR
jgi:predicted LPLAT superfamily acyltransferase